MARKAKAAPLYYKIGEACKELDIQPYVLRYWETEFPSLNPNKSKSGQRVYSQKELDTIRRIKELLYDEGYTIAGAKKRLETELEAGELGSSDQDPGQAAGSGADEAGKQEAAAELDTDAAEKIKTFRRGIEDALGQTREILNLLGSRP